MGGSILQIGNLEKIHWKLAEADAPIAFDTASYSGMSLAAGVELALILACNPAESFGFSTRIPTSPIMGLLRTSRWTERASKTKLRDGDLTVIVQPDSSVDTWWTQCIKDLLSELKSNGFPDRLARGLTGALIEMADNAWMHSASSSLGLVCYQIRRRQFAFSVADRGVGILGSLRTRAEYRELSSSMQAIRLAVKPGVSRLDHGGLGFATMMHSLADLWGSVRIRSGEAALVLDGRRDSRIAHAVYLPHLLGTHVSVRCSLDAPKTKT